MLPKSAHLVRGRDGIERIVIDLPEFQALLDAASESGHDIPDFKQIIQRLRKVFESHDAYVEADDFLADYDAAHDAH